MKHLTDYWIAFFTNKQPASWWQRKRQSLSERQADIVKLNVKGHLYHKWRYSHHETYHHSLHLTILIKQNSRFYIEESVQSFEAKFKADKCVSVEPIKVAPVIRIKKEKRYMNNQRARASRYDRQSAVQYAERWWNEYNPNFPHFTVDCTNFISQCLLAGGAPMSGAPNRNEGWWLSKGDWSFSWSVAHSLRWYLSGAMQGLRGKEVATASELNAGDIICYDFEGDGRWDHTTIVVAKDVNEEPLVNAHTDNSRHRFWSYEDSTAWTPEIQYKFFQINVTS